MFRFDLFLADDSIGSDPPLHASIFQPAADLIGQSPSTFSLLPAFEQYTIVHALTTKMHEIECSVRLKHHGGHMNCTIQSMLLLGDVDCQILHSHMPTYSTPKHSLSSPMSSLTMYQTPQSTCSVSGDASSSLTAKPTGGLSVVKAKLQNLLDSLDATHIA